MLIKSLPLFWTETLKQWLNSPKIIFPGTGSVINIISQHWFCVNLSSAFNFGTLFDVKVKCVITGSGIGLSPALCQANTKTCTELLPNVPKEQQWKICNQNTLWYKKEHLTMSSVRWWPFCSQCLLTNFASRLFWRVKWLRVSDSAASRVPGHREPHCWLQS